MRLKFSRYTGVVLGVIAVMVIAPVICAASTDTMGMMSETQGAVPQLVVTSGNMPSPSGGMPSHHILLNAVGVQVKTNHFVLSAAESFFWHPISSLTIEPSTSRTSNIRREIEYKIPLPPSVEYHCRNYLSSEEPPL